MREYTEITSRHACCYHCAAVRMPSLWLPRNFDHRNQSSTQAERWSNYKISPWLRPPQTFFSKPEIQRSAYSHTAVSKLECTEGSKTSLDYGCQKNIRPAPASCSVTNPKSELYPLWLHTPHQPRSMPLDCGLLLLHTTVQNRPEIYSFFEAATVVRKFRARLITHNYIQIKWDELLFIQIFCGLKN